MLSTVHYITSNINSQPWNLKEYCGLAFEKHLHNVLCYNLHSYLNKGLHIFETPNTRDDGKDIVIKSTIPFTAFGIDFSLKGKDEIKVYMECKSSNEYKIDLDKFSKNLLIANHEDIDYLILITNMTISPFAFFQAMQNARDYDYEFLLVDQFLLYKYLAESSFEIGNYTPPSKVEDLSVSYQICKGRLEGRPCFDLYLFFHNNIEKVSIARFRLQTDRNWKLSNSEFEVILDSHKAECKKIVVEKEFWDGSDDIVLDFMLNEEHKLVEVKGTSLNYNFETPLVGEAHKTIIRDLNNTIYENIHFKIFHLHGHAGIGKTRVIDEICKVSFERGVHITNYRCIKKQNGTTTDSFLKELEKVTGIVPKHTILETLQGITSCLVKYLIIIEDIHNATEEFFDEIEKLKSFITPKAPIVFILSGRDDYSVYNEKYFGFLDTFINISNDDFKDVEIKPLTDSECTSLIKMIIEEVPDSVLKKIQTASQNVPFYIVQFIEYLLEIDLIFLVNRNTVGISNITTFNQKLYIPPKVENIISARFKNLKQEKAGKKLQQFLLLLAFYELEFPKSLLVDLFSDEEMKQLDILFTRHFLKFSPSNQIMFDHENIYLFLKQQLMSSSVSKIVCKNIFDQPNIFNRLDELKKGRIFFHLNNYKDALICYEEPIKEISMMKNVSSENLNPLYFDYLEDIYFIHKKNKNERLQRKTVLAFMYLAMHNQENGKAACTFEKVSTWIEKYHSLDKKLIITFKQLQSHFYMQNGMLSKSQKNMNELIAMERVQKDLFDDNVRFNLFDRYASMNLQFNHKQPALLYNQLSKEIANQLEDKKLLTLSYITEAKIHFFENPATSYELMLKAQSCLTSENVERIKCHNDLSIITVKLLLKKDSPDVLLKETQTVLNKIIKLKYPTAEIRANFLLAVLYFIKNSLESANKHIEICIKISIRYGNSKLMAPIYNLKAMIAYVEKQPTELIYKYYSTMVSYLRHQNLLFLGALDFGYGNIINLTNYAKFLMEYGLESELYRFMGQISYYGSDISCDFDCNTNNHCYYSCLKNIEVFKTNIEKIKHNYGLIFIDQKYHYDLIHEKSNFLIPIGV